MDSTTNANSDTDTEPVLRLELHGMDPDTATAVYRGDADADAPAAGELLEAVHEAADDLGLDPESVSLTLTEKPPQPPMPTRDPDPVDPPAGWKGGRVDHTGGGIFCRIFRTDGTGRGAEDEYEVIYDADHPSQGVSLMRGTWDDEYESYIHENIVDGRREITDEADALAAARDLMTQFTDGTLDEA